tara:strand:+ start:146 stop:319 length:174 start_codon:yes stop_codon:yes gene_type:complete
VYILIANKINFAVIIQNTIIEIIFISFKAPILVQGFQKWFVQFFKNFHDMVPQIAMF